VSPPPVPRRPSEVPSRPSSSDLLPPARPSSSDALPPVPSRASKPALSSDPSFSSAAVAKVVLEMQHIAQALDLGVSTSRAALEALLQCTQTLEFLKQSAGNDVRLAEEVRRAVGLGETVAKKVAMKRNVEAYSEELQKIHIELNALQERASQLPRGNRNHQEMSGLVSMLQGRIQRVREYIPEELDESTELYSLKIDKLMLDLIATVRKLEERPPEPNMKPRIAHSNVELGSEHNSMRRTAESVPVLKVFFVCVFGFRVEPQKKFAEPVSLRRTAGDVESTSSASLRRTGSEVSPRPVLLRSPRTDLALVGGNEMRPKVDFVVFLPLFPRCDPFS
jgi:hypothetical protein